MIKLDKITCLFLTSMLFWPLMSYITFGLLGLRNITFYYTIITIFYGIVFIYFKKNIKVPKELYYLIFYIIFLFVWTFFNGEMERRGIIPILFNNPYITSFFIVLIIYNTRFSDRFIKKSIFILKITIIIAAIASVIQVFNPQFLNAWDLYNLDYNIFSGFYQMRRLSIFGYINLNSIGLSFMPILAILFGFLLYSKKRVYIVFLLLGGLSAFISNNRYVMVSFIIITLQVLFFWKVSLKGVFRYAAITFVLLISFKTILNFLGYDFNTWYETRLFAEGSIQETTRFKAIGTFLEFFPQFYLVGNGEITTHEIREASLAVGSSHIHIGYLSHLVAYGIVGCFFLYGFWYLLVKKLYRTAKQTNFWGSFFAFLTFLWAFATFSNSSIFFYGLIFSLVFDKYFKDNYLNSNYGKELRTNIK